MTYNEGWKDGYNLALEDVIAIAEELQAEKFGYSTSDGLVISQFLELLQIRLQEA